MQQSYPLKQFLHHLSDRSGPSGCLGDRTNGKTGLKVSSDENDAKVQAVGSDHSG